MIGIAEQRGIVTIWIAHVTFCMAFVTVVISSRLSELDKSLEEAAMDLGANRVKVFFLITLPIIAPALVSGWLLAFTLSLDDLVIASFVSGPSSTTLPMKVFSSVRLGVSPKINALATLMILAVSIAGAGCLVADGPRRKASPARHADGPATGLSKGVPMTVEITNPWTGQVDYRYDYVDQAKVEASPGQSRSGVRPRGRR